MNIERSGEDESKGEGKQEQWKQKQPRPNMMWIRCRRLILDTSGIQEAVQRCKCNQEGLNQTVTPYIPHLGVSPLLLPPPRRPSVYVVVVVVVVLFFFFFSSFSSSFSFTLSPLPPWWFSFSPFLLCALRASISSLVLLLFRIEKRTKRSRRSRDLARSGLLTISRRKRNGKARHVTANRITRHTRTRLKA